MVFIRSTLQSLHAAIDQLRPQNVERRFRELQKEFQKDRNESIEYKKTHGQSARRLNMLHYVIYVNLCKFILI